MAGIMFGESPWREFALYFQKCWEEKRSRNFAVFVFIFLGLVDFGSFAFGDGLVDGGREGELNSQPMAVRDRFSLFKSGEICPCMGLGLEPGAEGWGMWDLFPLTGRFEPSFSFNMKFWEGFSKFMFVLLFVWAFLVFWRCGGW